VFEGVPLNESYFETGHTLGHELMTPHRSYLHDLHRIRWKGSAHITGGGILGNLPRCLPEGFGARLNKAAWQVPEIFEIIRKRGRIADDEMYGTFNMGLGMILVVGRDEVPDGALVVGEVVRQIGPDRVEIR
jgi:phosphoribosylformylglycinamidine cyclo-ligase